MSKELKKAEKILKAMGNLTRLRILKFLKDKSDTSVIEISKGAKCSYKAASKHLSILLRVDLVDREQKSYEMHYSLSDSMDETAKLVLKTI